jgi:hypothetical protein
VKQGEEQSEVDASPKGVVLAPLSQERLRKIFVE